MIQTFNALINNTEKLFSTLLTGNYGLKMVLQHFVWILS